MKNRWMIVLLSLTLVAGLLAGLPAGLSAAPDAPAAPATLGWVGNMFPAGGSSNTITAGGAFTVYVQVWKDGVTNPSGQGAGITCSLYWGQVASFGGGWSNITDTPMVYNTDIGNNDEYKASISRGRGCTSSPRTAPMMAARPRCGRGAATAS